MNQELKPKFVAGIVDVDPTLDKEKARDNPYAFWEIDTIDEPTRKLVIDTYAKYKIDFVEHRIGKGYHQFGDKVSREVWKAWHDEIKHTNPKFPALTLRISKKYKDEVFERPQYYKNRYDPSGWAKALMFYLNKEIRGENVTNLHDSMKSVSLQKYFVNVVYPLCPICLVSGFDDTIIHMQKEHGVK